MMDCSNPAYIISSYMKHSILHVAGQSDAISAEIDPIKKGFQKHICKKCPSPVLNWPT
jgi:hypothetical protein